MRQKSLSVKDIQLLFNTQNSQNEKWGMEHFTCESRSPLIYASPCKICEHEQENGGTFASVGAQNFSLDYANVIIKFAQKCYVVSERC